MNFTSQPSGIVGANSPIIYQVYDAAYGNTDFYYELKVFVWNGAASFPASPVVTITRLPDQFASGRAFIDVHKIVLQYLSTENFTLGAYQPTLGTGCVNVGVKVQGIWNGGSTAVVNSNFILATNGYHYTSEGFNPNFSSVKLFTNAKTAYLTTDTESHYIWYDASYYTSITSGTATITPAAVTGSANRIQGVDIKQLMTAGGTWGTSGNITFAYSGGTTLYPVQFNCQNKYGQIDTLFLNRFGVWDSFTFNSINRQTIERNAQNYSRPVYRSATMSAAWSYGVQQGNRFNTETFISMLINTDWIPENMVDFMEEFHASMMVIVLDTTDLAAMVTDKNFIVKTAVNDKLIQYAFTLEYAQPRINTIVR